MNTDTPTERQRALRRFMPADRERLVAEFRASGLSCRAFSAQHGVKLATFYGWLQRKPKLETAAFASVEVPLRAAAPIEVLFPNGVRVAIRPAGTGVELPALLRSLAGCTGGA